MSTDDGVRQTSAGTQLPTVQKRHVEEIWTARYEYGIRMGGTLDAENTRTLSCTNCSIAFQPNVALTIENTGEVPVRNPRLVLNDHGNWYTFDSLLAEFTRGAKTDQEKVYFIWQNMRENLYHETPLFANDEPHDPVRLFNIFGFNLCDDAGNSGCSLFHHAGFAGSKNRSLHGHVQCEAFVHGRLQFMDVDQDSFYLDRENETPVSGDECARDHDLVRRELNFGAVVPAFEPSDTPAALFGPDDRLHDATLRGHEIAYTLRPGEKVIYRWDNTGKYAAESSKWAHRPPYYGNSQFVFQPRLTLAAVQEEAAATGVVAAAATGQGEKLAGASPDASLVYEIRLPYTICGGTVRAAFLGQDAGDRFSVALSRDGEAWQEMWTRQGAGAHTAEVALDAALDVHNAPAKYRYLVRVGLGSAGSATSAASEHARGANLCSLQIETDVLAAPASLPSLRLGENRAVYWDGTEGEHRVRITHEWQESDAVQPLPPPAVSAPEPGATARASLVPFAWTPVEGADCYHLQVSRRPDFRYPYRTSLDVIIPATRWCVPFTGIFSPDTTYYGRLRCRDQWGAWSAWSAPWTFTWEGPRVPVNVRVECTGSVATLRWDANPRGERPVRYEVYGSDEKGFSVQQAEHEVPGRGKAPGNLLATTDATALVVVSPDATAPNANRVFYRVVALDAHGTASGCSDYAEMPHPFIYTAPVTQTRVSQPYRYEVGSLRSLGDYQNKPERSRENNGNGYGYWDIEENRFALVEGPSWLTLDEVAGDLTGTPAGAGTARVRIAVTNQLGGRAEQQFDLHVAP